MLEDIHKNWIKLKEERNSANFSRWSLRKFFRTRKEKKEWKEKSENSLSSIPKASSRDLHVCGVVLANRKILGTFTASGTSQLVYQTVRTGGCVHGDLGMLVHRPLCMQVYKAWRVKVCVCIYAYRNTLWISNVPILSTLLRIFRITLDNLIMEIFIFEIIKREKKIPISLTLQTIW